MPVDVLEVTTTDAEVGWQALNDAYAVDRPPTVFRRVRERFRFGLRSMTAGDLRADSVRLTVDASAASHPMNHLHVATVLGGGMRFVAGRQDVLVRTGDVLLYPSDTGHWAEWEDIDVAVVRVSLATVDKAARSYPGTTAARFEAVRPVSPGAARQWRLLTGFVHQTLAGGGAALDGPLLHAELSGMVAATALAVFPNSTMTAAYRPEPGPALPATLRRAVAFIEEHAGEPITVVDIALAARVTPRALQLAFRRRYDTTPMGYLRRVRLAGAHRDLQAADPSTGATVSAIAARWGFGQAARFTTLYRSAYGVPPSQTLRT